MCPVNIYTHIYNTLSRVYNVHVYIHVYCYTSIRLIFKRVARTKMARSNLLITIRRDETIPSFFRSIFITRGNVTRGNRSRIEANEIRYEEGH